MCTLIQAMNHATVAVRQQDAHDDRIQEWSGDAPCVGGTDVERWAAIIGGSGRSTRRPGARSLPGGEADGHAGTSPRRSRASPSGVLTEPPQWQRQAHRWSAWDVGRDDVRSGRTPPGADASSYRRTRRQGHWQATPPAGNATGRRRNRQATPPAGNATGKQRHRQATPPASNATGKQRHRQAAQPASGATGRRRDRQAAQPAHTWLTSAVHSRIAPSARTRG
jgi:hypothetical protein